MASRISQHTMPELNRYRALCNFTQDETDVFNHLARGLTTKQICVALPFSDSTVARLSRRIRSKMARIDGVK